jgi:hypothetical protein
VFARFARDEAATFQDLNVELLFGHSTLQASKNGGNDSQITQDFQISYG